MRALKLERLKSEGRNELADVFSADSPVPFDFDELMTRLEADDSEMVPGSRGDKQGPLFGKLTRFIGRIRTRTDDRRFTFMFGDGVGDYGYDWLHTFAKQLLGTKPGIKVVDFSEVPSDVLPIIVGLLGRMLYEIHFWATDAARSPITIVCDEAHLYLPANAPDVSEARALEVYERIAKEGRKYGVSLVVVSQRPSDVSRTILSQCNNFIVLRLTNDQDQAVVSRLMPDNLAGITSALPLLDVGEAMLIGDESSYRRASALIHRPRSQRARQRTFGVNGRIRRFLRTTSSRRLNLCESNRAPNPSSANVAAKSALFPCTSQAWQSANSRKPQHRAVGLLRASADRRAHAQNLPGARCPVDGARLHVC